MCVSEPELHAPVPAVVGTAGELRLKAFVGRADLAGWLAGLACLLALPSLFIGFYLDDHIARYIYSNLEDAARLLDLYHGGYGLANGNPLDNHWQIEAGHAPWWTYPELRLAFFRPISLASHLLDFALWPKSAFLMHAHSILWLVLFVFAATHLYRGVLGTVTGGMAALLLALDHTHGLMVGFICNRHALITATFAVLCLDQHRRAIDSNRLWQGVLALGLYVVALLAGESALAIAGYLLGHALFVERAPLRTRALHFLPYVAATLIWRVLYDRAGYGGFGSGSYIDPGQDPGQFLGAFIERVPFLFLGQFFLPPPETFPQYGPLVAKLVWAIGLSLMAAVGAALLPVFRRDRSVGFWLTGFLIALVPASATEPHGRQLLLSSIAAMALIAQLWQAYAIELRGVTLPRGLRLSAATGGLALFVHLGISPVWLPVATCSVALAAPLHRAADDLGPEIAGKDVVFVSAPEYFTVRLVQLRKRVEAAPLPRRWRALSFGPQPITVERSDSNTLVIDFAGGVLSNAMLELFRDRRLRMQQGQRVELTGLSIEVLELTEDGRARRARFRFSESLDAPQFVFYRWVDHGNGFRRFTLPAIGERVQLAGAEFRPWHGPDVVRTLGDIQAEFVRIVTAPLR